MDEVLQVDDDLVEGITVAALAVLGVGDIAAILRAEAYLVADSCVSDVLRPQE